jgi:serine/threonine protein kinase
VSAFLDNQLKAEIADVDYCKKCLVELRAARAQGRLMGDPAPPKQLAKGVMDFAHLGNPQLTLDLEWTMVMSVATHLEKNDFKNLAKLLRRRPGNKGSPILANAVRFFFSREVETNQELFHGLAFAKLEGISGRQEAMFGAMTSLLEKHGERFSGVLEGTLTKIGVIELKIDEIHEMQQKALEILQGMQMASREVRPADSFSIRSDGERQFVKKMLDRYRDWPDERRREIPELLISVGKLEVATGDFDAAARDFREVATIAPDSKMKAEAHFNAFQAALEQKKYPEALSEIKQAVALDEERFAPFRFSEHDPVEILGAGGFGVVFRCKHPFLEKARVVKAIRTTDLDRNIMEVLGEANKLEKLDHPAIIKVFDSGFADKAHTRPYIVMEFFDGYNLEKYVEFEGYLSPDKLPGVAIPVAEALRVAHTGGICHRDVKPANILVRLDQDGWKVKLIDFGLAIEPSAFDAKIATRGPQEYTIANKTIAGTMRYAAPEQMQELAGDVQIGPHSDVYAFGRTCYFALLGTPDPDELERESLPEGWRRFLGRCTGRKLANRYKDFSEVLKELRALAEAKPDPVDPDGTVTPPPPPGDKTLFFLNAKGITASGRETSNGFTVLANSRAVAECVPSMPAKFAAVRQDLVKRQLLVNQDGVLILMKDQEFQSASAAATVMLGRNSNGRAEWKDADGRSLKDVQNARLAPEEILQARLQKIGRRIEKIERFEVTITFAGDPEQLPAYHYQIAANKEMTVAEWRDKRFKPLFPDCEVAVLLADGTEAHGATKLSTVRNSYLES